MNSMLTAVAGILVSLVAFMLLVSVSMTGAATQAGGIAQQTTVQFKRLNDVAADAVG
jgi:predicted Zn-dependent protease